MGVALLIALALSLDGFGVGLSYGMRRIKIPLNSMSVIALCTVVAMGSSMLFGHWLILWFPTAPSKILGAVILLALGGFQLFQAIRNRIDEEEAVTVMASPAPLTYEMVFKIRLEFFGLVIQVLKTPDLADIDGSGTISLGESFLLGCALAMDAFASGIGATLAGIPLYVVFIVALTQMVMLRLGQVLVGKLSYAFLGKAKFLPGTVLVIIGLTKLI